MGNAALCPSCHAVKSVRAQGHMQELDRTPDYYGCNSENTTDLGPWVSSKAQTRRGGWMVAEEQQCTSLVKTLNFLEGSWQNKTNVIKPPDGLWFGGMLLFPLHCAQCRVFVPSKLAFAVNCHLETSSDTASLIWRFVQSWTYILFRVTCSSVTDSLTFRLWNSVAYIYIFMYSSFFTRSQNIF